MKIAISGKGGTGKTTVAALLARALVSADKRVLAVDADPDANLAMALGCPDPRPVTPLAQRRDLVEQRTGADGGGYFKLNPRVDDLPDELAVDIGGVKLLVMGGVHQGGAGCVCPESTLVRSLVTYAMLAMDQALVLDMEAGLEHLGRGTARAVDHLLVVVEPGRRSVETARQVQKLAGDLGLESLWALGNRVRSDEDRAFLQQQLGELRFLGFLPFDDRILASDRAGRPPWEQAPDLLDVAAGWLARLAADSPLEDPAQVG